MADKKSVKRRKKGDFDEDAKPTADETAVCKYLRFNLETKKATMYGDESQYFYGSKAVDLLLDSKWASGKDKSSIHFTHRESIVAFLNRMLCYGKFFNRVHAIKIEKKVKEKKKDASEKKDEKSNLKDDKRPAGSPRAKKDGREGKKVKKKVKVTLEPHEYQVFIDNEEDAYVWIYDPVSLKKFVLGVVLVLFVILVCLFPLWPESIREYSWYLSVAGAIFVGFILALAVLRYIVYAIVFALSLGKMRFWFLPNLTAECGFFESFVPLYTYERKNKTISDVSRKATRQQEDRKPVDDGNESVESAKDEDWVKIKKGDVVDEKSPAHC